MYPVIVGDFPIPGRGILCIFIVRLTLKIALLLFTLLSAIKTHLENRPVIGNRINCS